MRKNELTVGQDYAVNTSRGRRWASHNKMTYLGDSPWLTGTGEANLFTVRYDDPNLAVEEDGVRRYRRPNGYMPVKIRNDNRILSHAGVDYLVQPDISGWRSSAFGGGKGVRGLFVQVTDDRVSFHLVAYGDKIRSTWAEELDMRERSRIAQAKADAERQMQEQYHLAMIREAIEVLDERGAKAALAGPYSGMTRKAICDDLNADEVPYWIRNRGNAAGLILLAAGKHDAWTVMLPGIEEERA